MIRLIIEDYLEEGSYVSFGGQANPPYGWWCISKEFHENRLGVILHSKDNC